MTKVVNLNKGHRERLRLRFLSEELDSFQPHEVLELLLFSIIPYKDTNKLAHELINHFGSLSNVLSASSDELCKFPNITELGATNLNLFPKLFRYFKQDSLKNTSKISTFSEILAYSIPLLEDSVVEETFLVCLDSKNCVISSSLMERGAINFVKVSPRKFIEKALSCNSSSVLIAHSHPGGFVKPSIDDDRFTEVLYQTLQSLDIILCEHIIINNSGEYYSYFKNGRIEQLSNEYRTRYNLKQLAQELGGIIDDKQTN